MTGGDAMIEAIAEAVAYRLRIWGVKQRVLSLEQAAEYLGMSDDTVLKLVSDGKLIACNGLDRRKRFDIRDLDVLIEQSKHK